MSQSTSCHRLGVAVVLGVLLSACSNEPEAVDIQIAPGITQAERAGVGQALEALFQSCPGLVRYRQDLQQTAPARIVKDDPYYLREYGWNEAVQIGFRVKDQPAGIPRGYFAQGHVCTYGIGVGDRPGIETVKSACTAVCRDESHQESGPQHIAVQGLELNL